jgi:hypothetical protein
MQTISLHQSRVNMHYPHHALSVMANEISRVLLRKNQQGLPSLKDDREQIFMLCE